MSRIPNLITLSRIPMLFVVVTLMYMPWHGAMTLAFGLFVVAAVTDWLDGFIARRMNTVSRFGTLMDALSDKVFILGLFVAMLKGLPGWAMPCVLLMITREFLVTGLRLVAMANGSVLAAQKMGKLKTVLQSVSIGCLMAYWSAAFDLGLAFPKVFYDAFYAFSLSVFILATLLTVITGIAYGMQHWRLLMSES